MRYIMSLNPQWFQTCRPSKFKVCKESLLRWTFFRTLNFDGLQVWNHWEFRDIIYLILKV